MTSIRPRGTAPRQWEEIPRAAIVTAAMAQRALAEMEVRHTRGLEQQRPAAERLVQVTVEMAEPYLHRRAQLILANIMIHGGELMEGAALARSTLAEAESVSDMFAMSRSHYLLAWTSYSFGDLAATRHNGIRGIELLPEDSPTGMRIDHLMVAGIGFTRGPESDQYFSEALKLSRDGDDGARLINLHNNMAVVFSERGDLERATDHVREMFAIRERSGETILGIQLETIASVYNMTGRYQDAVRVLQPLVDALNDPTTPTAVEIHNETRALPHGLLTLAQAHRHLGAYESAQSMLDEAWKLATTRNLQMIAANIRAEQAFLHAAQGDYRRAFDDHVKFHQAVETLHSEDQQARASLVQASFEAERSRKDANKYRELAMRDALTGLYNRRYMDDLLDREVHSDFGEGSELSLAIVDADFFKRINDEISHDVGDVVLRALAHLLIGAQHPSDTVCRLGGEEFVVVMPNSGAGEALARCEKLRIDIEEFDWSVYTGDIPVTVSIGVTTAVRGRTSASALLSDSDRNLYSAKRSGRNRVVGDT